MKRPKISQEAKRLNRERFKSACAGYGLKVEVYGNGVHLRAFGQYAIDFWPGTGRWWHTGTSESAKIDGLNEALAACAGREVRPMEALSFETRAKKVRKPFVPPERAIVVRNVFASDHGGESGQFSDVPW